MRKLLTCIMLLLSTALIAQNKGQLYNEGTLYVSPGTLMTAESGFINDSTGQYNNDGEVLLKGDFLNHGNAGFTLPGGLTRFEGSQIQQIAGSRTSDYFNVLFKNSNDLYPFHLSGGMSIFGTVSFEQGIVDNKNYPGRIIFQKGSGYSDASNKSYVEGAVGKKGGTDFAYPIGKRGYFRPGATMLNGQTGTYFSGEFYWENSDSLYNHDLKEPQIVYIDDEEYWTMEDSTGADGRVFVKLTWLDVTTPDRIMDVALNGSSDYRLVIVRWSATSSKWVSEGGTVDVGRKSVTSDSVSGFGAFTFGLIRREKKELPVANDDNSIDNPPGQQVVIDVVNNDEPGNQGDLDPSTVGLYPSTGTCIEMGDEGRCKAVNVPDEGVWNVNVLGKVSFTPKAGFSGSPSPIEYTVEDESGQESNRATITIEVVDAGDLFIPNTFTPNGDGHNDVWKVYGTTIKDIYLMVYNQYGQKIFETRDLNGAWDGRYKGRMQPAAVYVYYAKITLQNGSVVTKKGSITLIR